MPLLTEEIDKALADLTATDCQPEVIYLTDEGHKRLLSEIQPQGLKMTITHYQNVPINTVRGCTPEFFITGKQKPAA